MNLRELLEAVATDEERDDPRSVVMREGKAIEMIGRAIFQDGRAAPDFMRRSDRRKLEIHLDQLDMASKEAREALRKWKV